MYRVEQDFEDEVLSRCFFNEKVKSYLFLRLKKGGMQIFINDPIHSEKTFAVLQ